ncbi:MAG TPA: anti-sigma regulatory factor [Gemmatimonadaceae bacterium]|nr:anti-sigma regulatory factor [Gemmatimonadaceae bacterium]
MGDDAIQPITSDSDVVAARQRGRTLASQIGFSVGDQTVIAAAISEIARNILLYAKRGEVKFESMKNGERVGLRVIARDSGPGIRDIQRAMTDGFSTSGGLGLGLPGARRLMDEFEVVSAPGNGTTVEMTKWKP